MLAKKWTDDRTCGIRNDLLWTGLGEKCFL